MKRLMIVCAVFVSPMFLTSNMYAEDDLHLLYQSDSSGTPEEGYDDYLNHGSSSFKDEDLHGFDLDTLNIKGSGNWLNKRIWYEKAQAAFDDVLQEVNKVVDMREQFSNEVTIIGHKIDAFYESVNFDKGELDDKFKEILVDLDLEKKLKGDLSEKEQSLQTAIKQELSSLDELGRMIKSIVDVDVKIDQTLMQAFKTIDECRDYEEKSWAAFKAIGKEIDDKKAQNLYYEINNFKENIEQKSNYISSSLLPYLHNILVAKIESNIVKINQLIEQLKQKGIDLSVIMKTEQESDLAQLKQREQEAQDLAVEKALELEHEKQAQEEQEAALALKKKQESTWSYTLYGYYDYAKQSFFAVGTLIQSYKFPVASYLYASLIGLSENLMSYFKSTPKAKNKAVEPITEPVADISQATEHQSDASAIMVPETQVSSENSTHVSEPAALETSHDDKQV